MSIPSILKLICIANTLLFVGCQVESEAQSEEETDFTYRYAEVVEIEPDAILAESGTILKPETRSKTEPTIGNTTTKVMSPQEYYQFEPIQQEIDLTFDSSVTVLSNTCTISMEDIQEGDLLKLTYYENQLKVIERLTTPD